MAQTTQILQGLKRLLKQQGIRYLEVANHLGISEASVKRLFAEEAFSLKRVDQICQMMDLELSDVLLHIRSEDKISALSHEQEAELVADLNLLLVANSVLNRWSFNDILEHYEFKETELIRLLARLDRLKLIQLLPANRIKVMVDRSFSWLPDGPIHRFFDEQVKKEFFNSRFKQAGEKRLFMVGMLSRAANAVMQRKLDRLYEEFYALHYEDEKLAREEKFGTTIVLGMRLWEPGVFEQKRREPDQRKF